MHIRTDVVEAIAAHATRERPRECCGILVAADGEIVEAVAAENVAAEPTRRYEVSPADHFTQIRRCRDSVRAGIRPLRIAGVYHSHPHSDPVPSATDLDQAWAEYLYVIAGPVDDSNSIDIRGYRLRDGRFVEVQLTVAAGPDRRRLPDDSP